MDSNQRTDYDRYWVSTRFTATGWKRVYEDRNDIVIEGFRSYYVAGERKYDNINLYLFESSPFYRYALSILPLLDGNARIPMFVSGSAWITANPRGTCDLRFSRIQQLLMIQPVPRTEGSEPVEEAPTDHQQARPEEESWVPVQKPRLRAQATAEVVHPTTGTEPHQPVSAVEAMEPATAPSTARQAPPTRSQTTSQNRASSGRARPTTNWKPGTPVEVPEEDDENFEDPFADVQFPTGG